MSMINSTLPIQMKVLAKSGYGHYTLLVIPSFIILKNLVLNVK